jgi:xanthosine utilization system XapX-like protein
VNGWVEEVLLQSKLGPVQWVRIKSTDNPTLPPSWFVELRRRLSKRQYKIFVEGEFAAAEGSVYPLFYTAIHASGTLAIDPLLPVYVGQDFNLVPMASVLVQCLPHCILHDTPKCFHVVGELIEEGTTEQHAVKLQRYLAHLKRQHNDPRQVLLIPDSIPYSRPRFGRSSKTTRP